MSNFDFNKAINGEPIYCNLDCKLITPYYSITEKQFLWGGANWDINGNAINSLALKLYGNLSTDPPKKKVKKTVWTNIYKNGHIIYNGLIHHTNDEAAKERYRDIKSYIGCYPIEIEVEE